MKQETKIILGIAIFTILVFGGIVLYSSKHNVLGPISADVLIKTDSQKIGQEGAKVALVEFGDYQCPACGVVHPIVKQILKDYEGKILFVFRNFPLSQHQYAVVSSEAAEIAGDQGKFWEMHDMLFENQNEWASSKDPREIFAKYAQKIGLNVDEFKKSLDADKYSDKIERDKSDGNSANINATPTFFVNGSKLILNSPDDLKKAIDDALK